MEWSNVGSFSVMDQIALLKRAPKGVSREEMAVFWLLIAAENGHEEAQSELGSHWVVPDYFVGPDKPLLMNQAGIGAG